MRFGKAVVTLAGRALLEEVGCWGLLSTFYDVPFCLFVFELNISAPPYSTLHGMPTTSPFSKRSRQTRGNLCNYSWSEFFCFQIVLFQVSTNDKSDKCNYMFFNLAHTILDDKSSKMWAPMHLL